MTKRPGMILFVILASVLSASAQRIAVPTGGHPSRGPAEAAVTIIEFGDFECPHCGGMYSTLKQIEADYFGQVRIVFRQLPLRSVHPHAQEAAEASLCALDQDRFWEYHDALFENQEKLDHQSLVSHARNLGLDTELFRSCMNSGEKRQVVDADLQAAIDAGAYSSPTLYINGEMMTGNWPYREVARMIDAELFRLLRQDLAR